MPRSRRYGFLQVAASTFCLILWIFASHVAAGTASVPPDRLQRTVNVMLMPSQKNSSIERSLLQDFMDVNFTPKTGIKVVIHMTATRITTDYASQLQLYLSTNDSSMDIFQMDVVWPPEFAEYLVDLSPSIPAGVAEAHNRAMWENNNVNGRQIAVPFYADYGLFYYRDDLLAKYGYTGPPETWDEMEEMAKKITSKEPSVVGYVGQFNAYEGLTCNLMEWLHSADAGSIIAPNGSVVLDSPATRAMLARVRNWFMNGVTPKYALSYTETEAQDKFQSGEAVFMRYWPSAMLTMRQAGVNFSFKVTGLPGTSRQTKFASTLGGWQLALSKATKDEEAALSTLFFMATAEFQKFRFMTLGLFPTVSSLYQDPEVCEKVDCELFGNLNVTVRPSSRSGAHYLEVSRLLYTVVNSYFGQKMSLDAALDESVLGIEQTIGTYTAIIVSQARFIHYDDIITKVCAVLAFVGILSAIVLTVFVRINRKNPVMIAASPDFLCLIMLGVVLELGAILLFVGKPTNAVCIAQPYVITLGYATAYSALLTKTWRIHRIFDAKFAKVGRSLTSAKLMKFVGIYVGVNLAILLAWTFTNAPQVTAIFQTPHNAYLSCTSTADTPFTATLFTLNGLMLVFGSWLAYKTRNIDEEYRESFYIAIIMYNTLIWACIPVGFVFIPSLGQELHFSIRSISILMSCFGVLVFLMGPKVKAVYYGVPKVEEVSLLSDDLRRLSLLQQQTSYAKPTLRRPSTSPELDRYTTDSVRVDYRTGTSLLFMGAWRAAKLNLFEAKDGILVALQKTGKRGKLAESQMIHCFALKNDEPVTVTFSDEVSENEKKLMTAHIKLREGLVFELVSDDTRKLTAILERLKAHGKSVNPNSSNTPK
ncbi:hypothetical protein CcCBS67573_g04237 [Chytriomyces confervae]|uniref:G-protein coupled receptors family 3 profile domain-containing protein n=1 Tax=Chytriomyces confervae TaxID=246404 RepID=A0A507FGN3_9FUNG|nr:hypothetical protein CcCBS67573_g04237 [Chytriomyces confervae]